MLCLGYVLLRYILIYNLEVCFNFYLTFLQLIKRMLCLGYVLLRNILIYNLEVCFNFYLTFLQLNVIKMFTVQ